MLTRSITKMAGHYLSIPSEKLTAIEREKDTEDQRKMALLDTWHKRKGRGASYWRLANALYQHGRQDLVEFLCRALSSVEQSSSQATKDSAYSSPITSKLDHLALVEV